MNYIKNYFLAKRVGFYVGLASAILLIVFGFLFLSAYGTSIYMNPWIVALPIIVALIFIGLSFYRPLEGVGPIVMAFGAVGTLCIFALKTYPYLSEVFYGGFNAESFAALSPVYFALFLIILFAVICAIVSVFTKKSVDKSLPVIKENEEEAK